LSKGRPQGDARRVRPQTRQGDLWDPESGRIIFVHKRRGRGIFLRRREGLWFGSAQADTWSPFKFLKCTGNDGESILPLGRGPVVYAISKRTSMRFNGQPSKEATPFQVALGGGVVHPIEGPGKRVKNLGKSPVLVNRRREGKKANATGALSPIRGQASINRLPKYRRRRGHIVAGGDRLSLRARPERRRGPRSHSSPRAATTNITGSSE